MNERNQEVFDRGSLPEMLAQRARQSSDKRLAIDVAAGLIVAATLAILRPPLWVPFAGFALCLGAYGLWGILDREIGEARSAPGRGKSLSVARALVAFVGAAAAVLSGLMLFFSLLGVWNL